MQLPLKSVLLYFPPNSHVPPKNCGRVRVWHTLTSIWLVIRLQPKLTGTAYSASPGLLAGREVAHCLHPKTQSQLRAPNLMLNQGPSEPCYATGS